MTAKELLSFLLDIEKRALAALDDVQVDAIALQTFRVRELEHLLGLIVVAEIRDGSAAAIVDGTAIAQNPSAVRTT